ncbi:class I SAM-dependent methyltransferase [Haloarcula sp. S1AR25-5A]|uniref:Class I SAM-dependent methyltransferase n=1 Tax=Haloarcula terrestris TaxID=2950533 RepID=A0AAE4JHA0_9EURY|nr:class I SAM-dependent methyltransferase [Haloarcula terrestris]MDS0222333.1 class I SAM-dependent methyltransferase [Haloarcula terrestris]
MTESFQRYLRAKRTVDDRALDRRLVETLRNQLASRAADTDGPLRVLEIGAGIGTMLTRFIDWDVLPAGDVRYTAVDIESANTATIPAYLREWAADSEATVTDDPLTVDAGDRRIEVETVVADAVEYADDADGYDLLVGAALLDIIGRDRLPTLLSGLAPGGHYYFPITFDGATRFRPTHPADRAVEAHYHDHMDRKPGGDSRAGDDVLDRLQRLDGATLSGAAGSDWIVRPVDGAYPADEAYFLQHILDTVEAAVREVAGNDFDALDDWLARRREQVAAAELLYCTHQLDFLGRVTTLAEVDS